MGTPDGQLEQHGVQAHERGRPGGRATQPGARARGQRHRAEAAERGQRLERPQTARDAQRNRCVARQREQRSVGGVLKRPAQEREHGVGWRFSGQMRIGVEAVQGAEARVAEIAEHVLGDERRPEQQGHVRRHDRRHDRAHLQPPRAREHHEVARAHEQRERLKAAATDAEVKPPQRPG